MTPENLRDLIDDRALNTLIEAGLADTDLSDHTIEDLKAIHGIGPKWAAEIRDALDNLASPQDHPVVDKTQEAFDLALALLTNCDRPHDVANLKASEKPLDEKLHISLNILENLQGGDRGMNLANQVRAVLA